jgi:cell division protein FtsB
MAKAILGYMSATDPRTTTRLASENRLLRQRISDLEAAVVRLQQENDALAALVSEDNEGALTPA